MRRKVNALPAMIFTLVLILLTVAGCRQADVERAADVKKTGTEDVSPSTVSVEGGAISSKEPRAEARAGGGKAVAKAGGAEARASNGKASARARAEDVAAGNSKAKAGDVVVGGGEVAEEGVAGADPGEVRLEIGGEPGASFSGTCAVGGEEREISGPVPGRFVFGPEGRELGCGIRNVNPDAGPLKFSVFSINTDGKNKKQKIEVTGDNLKFTLSENGISYTTSSTSGSVVQKSSVSSSSYSRSSSSSGSR